MNILFLVRSLNYGGSERQLVLLAKGFKDRGHTVNVAVFYREGGLVTELKEANVHVHLLKKRGRWDVVGFFLRLTSLIRRVKPDVLYSFLPIPNILSLFVNPIYPSLRVVWGVRASNLDLRHYDWLRGFSYLLERKLSSFAKTIIVNSRAGRAYAESVGFPPENIIVIPNGIDTERFRPDPSARKLLREQWGLSKCENLIGLVCRLDPMKDHPTFLHAAALLLQELKAVRFVCVGDGPQDYRLELQQLGKDLGLDHYLVWAGSRDDMAAVYSALDVACSSSSFGEGFSNAIGEAMACETPCVVTDVGDSAEIVGSTGEVVPVKDPQGLRDGWQRMLVRLHHQPSCRLEARRRIVEHFGLKSFLDNTEGALKRLC